MTTTDDVRQHQPVAITAPDATALLTALVTEQSIQQTIAGSTISESSGRASLYMTSLSAVLVSLGFASASIRVFDPFAAAVLPTLFLLGCFTISRLTDTAIESVVALERVSLIRSYYLTLHPDAATYFPTAGHKAGSGTSDIGLAKKRFSLLFTMATMIATVNAVLGGSGVVLLLVRAADMSMNIAVPIGLVTAAACLAAAIYYQNRRFLQAFPNA
jgi:hypothetical protein